MSQDLSFNTQDAAKHFPIKAGEVRYETDEYGVENQYVLADTQNIGGWCGIVCPSGQTLVADKPETRAALLAAGIEWEVV